MSTYKTKLCLSTLIFSIIATTGISQASTTITVDNSFGTGQTVNGSYSAYYIMENMGSRPNNGVNLFHSFGEFFLDSGDAAVFLGNSNIRNIITRVTGGNASTINGTLASGIYGANFFMINPDGILVGPTAAMQVTGAVYLSTADYLEMENGDAFYADTSQTSVLSVATPQSFGFLDDTVGAISVTGSQISAAYQQHISFIGGDFTLTNGFVSAEDGRINVASVASQGKVAIQNSGISATNATMGNIAIYNGRLDVSANGTGKIYVKGGNLVMQAASILAHTFGAGSGGKINVALIGDITMGASSYLAAVGTNNSTGNAGAISVQANNIGLSQSSQFDVFANGSGNGGSISVNAKGSITMTESQSYSNPTGIGTFAYGGDVGDIDIQANSLVLDGESWITVDTYGMGTGGNLTINASQIQLTNGAQIAAGTKGGGRAGNLVVAADTLTIDGTSTGISTGGHKLSSGLFTPTAANGNAGNLTVTANHIDLSNGATLAAYAQQAGHGGTIQVNVDAINISNYSGIETGTRGAGNGGDISIRANTFNVSNSSINASTNNTGNGGQILIQPLGETSSATLALSQGGILSATASSSGDGGSLTIKSGSISIVGKNSSGVKSSITVSTSDSGAGGDIKIESRYLSMSDFGSITATASGNGSAGTISVQTTETLSISSGAGISAGTSGAGNGGSMILNANLANITGTGPSDTTTGLFATTTASGIGGSIQATMPQMYLTNGGAISASSQGSGAAGTILINTSDLLELTLGANIKTDTSGAGSGGNIAATAGTLSIASNAKISASSSGAGAGGGIILNSDQMTITGASPSDTSTGLFATATANGSGGSIQATMQQMHLTNGGAISASSKGSGAAGTILVDAADAIKLTNGATISTDSASAGGGGITINAVNQLQLINSAITTSVNGGGGNAGNIDIDPIFVILEGSTIRANAFDGDGGSIHIQAQHFFIDPDSVVEASSQLGIDGSIEIDSPGADDKVVIETLPQTFVDSSQMLQSTCAAQALGKSSFSAQAVSFYSGGSEFAAKTSADDGSLTVTNQPGSISTNTSVGALVRSNHNTEMVAASCTL